MEQHANIAFVEPAREKRRMTQKARAGSIEEHEMVERDEGAAAAFCRDFVRSNTYPRHTSVDAMRCRLGTNSSDPNDSIELPGTHVTHAVVDAEPAVPVRITRMCTLVDERSHTLQKRMLCQRPNAQLSC